MSDLELLFLVVSGFYLAECAFWVRTGMFVFLSQLGERHRGRNLHWALFRNPNGGVIWGNLSPCGQASICQQWPLSMSPQGIYSFVSQALSSDGRPRQPERAIAYADIRQVEARGHDLVINGVLFTRLAVPAFARRLARLIKELQHLPQDQRAGAIAAALAQHLDPQEVAQRLALFRRLAADLQLTCLVLFFLVFLWPPVLIWLNSPLPFLVLAGCYVGMVFLAVLQFRRAHVILYPEEKLERFKNMLLVLLSPADAIHARDKLSHPLLGEFHPLAVARAVCGPARFEQFAAHVWRDLEYPILPVCPVADGAPQEIEAWFRACLRGQMEKFLTDAGVETAPWLRPPAPDHPSSRSYCPRCLGQYVMATGFCADCGRPLVAWKAGAEDCGKKGETSP